MRWFTFIFVSFLATLVYAQPSRDDTPLIQAEMDKGGVVKFPSGNFVIKPLKWVSSIVSVEGGPPEAPTNLILYDNSGEWAQVLKPVFTGSAAKVIEIKNLRFEMNRDKQGWDGKYNMEHQAAISVTAKDATGDCFLKLSNIRVSNCAGDGVYVGPKVRCEFEKLYMEDVHRGGVTITGNGCKVLLKHSKFVRCGFQIEANSEADVTDVTLDNVTLSVFDVILTPKSKFYATDVIHTGGMFHLGCSPLATFYCADSKFQADANRIRIRTAGNSTFQRCAFTGFAATGSNVINVAWSEGQTMQKNQTLTFKWCTIDGPGLLGIDLGTDALANNNVCTLDHCFINGVPKAVAYYKGRVGILKLIESYHNGVLLK